MASGNRPTPSSSRQNLAKRACDPCRVRKIKCSQLSPCSGCVSAGTACTFRKAQLTRGPRSLRSRTIDRIARTQEVRREESPRPDPSLSAAAASGSKQLIDLLDIYATRLYPIWPLVETEKLSLDVAADPRNERAHHLAEAVALATAAQLKLMCPWNLTAQKVEQDDGEAEGNLLDSLRVSFFLHVYHENQAAGGVKSLLHLREAITKAQILRIDRESTYASLDESDQQLCRRTLWLLFITERGVAMLHKLPVVLKPNIIFPWYGTFNDNFHALPAFLKLVHLFWVFDQSGIFELLRNSDSDVSSMASLAQSCLDLLRKKLQEDSAADDVPANDVQRADMFVTRQWMRAVLWRAALRFGIVVPDNNPIDVADKFLALVSQLPKVALESHGPTLEFKTFEIATTVIDEMASNSHQRTIGSHKVLLGLQHILSSSRGGNMTLLTLLDIRLASVAPDVRLLPQPFTNGAAASYDPASTGRQPQCNDQNTLMSTLGEIPLYSGELDPCMVEQQTAAQMFWPRLDMGSPLSPRSPMTQVLLGFTEVD